MKADSFLIPILLGLPLLGALALGFLPSWGKRIALSLALIALILLAGMAFSGEFPGRLALIGEIGLVPSWGLTGVNLPFLLLTALLLPLLLLVGWDEPTGFLAGLMIAGSGLMTTFAAQDLLLFLLGWLLTFLATYFLFSGWGKNPFSAQKFLLMNGLALFLLFFAFVAISVSSGNQTDFTQLLSVKPLVNAPFWLQVSVFSAILIAFLIPLAPFPFHSWFLESFESAPPALRILTAAGFLKVGTYGLVLFAAGMFPSLLRASVPLLLFLGILTALGAALVSFKQTDLNALIATATVSLGGMSLIGIFSGQLPGIEGALLLSLGNGLAVAALLALPSASVWLIPAAFAFLGLPGFLGFAGSHLLLSGAWLIQPWIATALVFSQWLIFGALVLYFGLSKTEKKLRVFSVNRVFPAVSLIFLSLWLGVFTNLLLVSLNRALVPIMPLFGF
jgi:NADH-quinone oxidoreductase subunit M